MFHAPKSVVVPHTRTIGMRKANAISADENEVPKGLAATTATGKLIKAASGTGNTIPSGHTHSLKANSTGAPKPLVKRSNSALVTKPLGARRNSNVIDKDEAATDKPSLRGVRQRSSSSSLVTGARPQGALRCKLNGAGPNSAASGNVSLRGGGGPRKVPGEGGVRKRSSSAMLSSSLPISRPGLRSKGSSASLSAVDIRSAVVAVGPSNVIVLDTIPTTSTTAAPTLSKATPIAQPLRRLDSDATAVDDNESAATTRKMELDGRKEDSYRDAEDTESESCPGDTNSSTELPLKSISTDPTSLEYIMANYQEDLDMFDTTMVPEYANEIFTYMHKLELRMLPAGDYMDRQKELEWSMRGILIDWLVQVHMRFRLLPETLFLCVNYIDRFLTRKVVSLEKLQLVGTTALLIASKFEEVQVPSVSDFVYMVDHAYTVDEVLKAERFMVSLLDFDLAFPGPMSFLRRISKADDYDIQTRTLAKYLIEVTIMDEKFLPFPISHTAAAGHYLARKMLSKGSWTDAHVYYSGFTEPMLQDAAQLLLRALAQPKGHNAIYEKYTDRKFMKASLFVQQWLASHPV